MPERSKAFRLTESLLQLRTLLLSLSLLHRQCSFRVCYGMGRVCEQNANGVWSVAQSPFLPGSKVTRPLLHSVTREQMRPWLILLHHLAPHLFRQVTEPRGHLCLDPGHSAGEVSWHLQVCVCVCIREKEREGGGGNVCILLNVWRRGGVYLWGREVENWIIGVNMLSLVKDITLKIWALLGVDESFSRWAQPLCVLVLFFCVYLYVSACVVVYFYAWLLSGYFRTVCVSSTLPWILIVLCLPPWACLRVWALIYALTSCEYVLVCCICICVLHSNTHMSYISC